MPARSSDDLQGVVALYNLALAGRHGYFPLCAERFASRILASPWFISELFLLALADGKVVGMIHGADLRDPCYEEGGVIELLVIHPAYRNQGIEEWLLDSLLKRLWDRKIWLLDAGGTFPFTPFYTTLIDGSERSGFFRSDQELIALFMSRGFTERHTSLVMRADLFARHDQEEAPPEAVPCHLRLIPRTLEETWLDHVFRDWPLEDSHLVETATGRVLSRAIVSPMEDLSLQEGHVLYAVFGVNTPPPLRGKGYARHHFRLLQNELCDRGVDLMELHVFADNTPAVHLYRQSGFVEIARTVTLRRTR